MPGPRKVRIFRDRKKSPNWYVEWRDFQGKRRCESCGPRQEKAKERANQLQAELQAARLAGQQGATLITTASTEPVAGTANQSSTAVTQIMRLQTLFRFGQKEVPVNLTIELTPELLQAIREAISGSSLI